MSLTRMNSPELVTWLFGARVGSVRMLPGTQKDADVKSYKAQAESFVSQFSRLPECLNLNALHMGLSEW